MEKKKKNRTLEEVIESMPASSTKNELEKFLESGGLLYRDVDTRRNDVIVCDEYDYMQENWETNEELRAEFSSFAEYARYEAEACLKMLGMSEKEVEEDLRNWTFEK